jgi:hypothetical protein
MDRYVSGDDIDAEDVVFWYRDGFRHDGPADCEIGGPTLRPVVLPAARITANGREGLLTLGGADPLRVELAFDAGPAGALNPAEVYIGVAGTAGLFFLDPGLGFVTTPVRVFGGALASFDPLVLFDLPSAGVLPPGPYVWFMIVDGDVDGAVDGTFFSYVVTILSP